LQNSPPNIAHASTASGTHLSIAGHRRIELHGDRLRQHYAGSYRDRRQYNIVVHAEFRRRGARFGCDLYNTERRNLPQQPADAADHVVCKVQQHHLAAFATDNAATQGIEHAALRRVGPASEIAVEP
jgi:hypothetical protein